MIFWTDPRVDRLLHTLDPERRQRLVGNLELTKAHASVEPQKGQFVDVDRGLAVRAFDVTGMDLQVTYRFIEPGIAQVKVDIPRPPLPIREQERVHLWEQSLELARGPEARLRAQALTVRERTEKLQRALRAGAVDERTHVRAALERESVYSAILHRANHERGLDTPGLDIRRATQHLPDPGEAQFQIHAARLVDGVELGNVNRLYVEQTLRRINDRDMRRDRGDRGERGRDR